MEILQSLLIWLTGNCHQGNVIAMLGQILDSLLLSVADAWGSACMTDRFSVVLPLVDPVRR